MTPCHVTHTASPIAYALCTAVYGLAVIAFCIKVIRDNRKR